MSEAAQKQLFKPWTVLQDQCSRRLNPKGHGLGLSICLKIVEALEGEISVSSLLGEGSVFIVKLPLSYEPQMLAEQSEQVNR